MRRRRFGGSLRRYFATGLLSLLPTVVVVYLVGFLFGKWMDATRWVTALLAIPIWEWANHLVSAMFLLLGLAVIIMIGVVSTTLVGRAAARVWYRVIYHIPILSRVYAAVEQVGSALTFRSRVFKGVVLVQYPREGLYRVGLVTSDGLSDVVEGESMLAVFVPNTPNPMTGFLFMTTEDLVTPLDVTVEEAIKMVVSGGFVTPSEARSLEEGPRSAPLLWRTGRGDDGA